MNRFLKQWSSRFGAEPGRRKNPFAGMPRRWIRYASLWGTLALFCTAIGLPAQAASQSPYDQAVEVRHVGLKPDPLNPQAKREVACFRYPHFVVKQVDHGEVGAERLSILPASPGAAPACREERERKEYVIPSKSWSGYFDGVKSGYAFFNAADGVNGGLGFMVFRVPDRKKLFEDVAEKGIQSIESKDGALTLRYQRVFSAGCSVVTGGAACREKIAKETGVAGGPLSSCAAGYKAAKEEMAKMRCEAETTKDAACFDKELKRLDEQKWDDVPSVVVYEVEVSFGKASPVIRPLGDALVCRPSD